MKPTTSSHADPVSQAEFTAAMRDARADIPSGLLDAKRQPAGRRFSVYRNNVAVSLREALYTGFPVITKLLGTENMDGLAGIFVRAHPPKSPLMMHYGEEFPEFLAGMQQLSHLAYLPDVARLELALRRSYHAKDVTPTDTKALTQLSSDELMQAKIELAPSVQVATSRWPIYDIWRFNTQDDAPKPKHIAQDVLIVRNDFDPTLQILPVGGAAFINALQRGETLVDANDTTTKVLPKFDLSTTLRLLISSNALTKIKGLHP